MQCCNACMVCHRQNHTWDPNLERILGAPNLLQLGPHCQWPGLKFATTECHWWWDKWAAQNNKQLHCEQWCLSTCPDRAEPVPNYHLVAGSGEVYEIMNHGELEEIPRAPEHTDKGKKGTLQVNFPLPYQGSTSPRSLLTFKDSLKNKPLMMTQLIPPPQKPHLLFGWRVTHCHSSHAKLLSQHSHNQISPSATLSKTINHVSL